MTDESKQQYLGWRDGLPTAPDVEAIIRQWPDLKVADRIPYSEIEGLLKIQARSPRWKSVTDTWRRRMREKGIVIECENADAFYVATAEQVSAATYGILKGIGRKARKHREKIAVSKPVNDSQRVALEHQARLMHGIERDSRKARMNLLPPTAAPEQPRIAAPESKAKK